MDEWMDGWSGAGGTWCGKLTRLAQAGGKGRLFGVLRVPAEALVWSRGTLVWSCEALVWPSKALVWPSNIFKPVMGSSPREG